MSALLATNLRDFRRPADPDCPICFALLCYAMLAGSALRRDPPGGPGNVILVRIVAQERVPEAPIFPTQREPTGGAVG